MCSIEANGWRSWPAPARCTPGDELMAVAGRLGAGVAKALLGEGALPDDLPHVKAKAKEWSDGLRERK